jgi:hypothetical protein
MRYNKKKLYEQAIEAIEKNNLFFVDDIVAFLPCGKTWWYQNFPADSEEMNNLKRLLDINKTKTKSAIRAKLFKSDKAGELLALYRLIADEDERQKLNQQYIEMKTNINKIEYEVIKDESED